LQKIIFILAVLFVIPGCSLLRRGSPSPNENINVNKRNPDIILRNNLSNQSFFLEKGEVSYKTDSVKENFLISLKLEYPDKYLISLRSKTGIEALRIFLTKDTLLINDRINKKLYYGKEKYLNSRFGVSLGMIPVLLGDLVLRSGWDNDQLICENSLSNIETSIRGQKLDYVIDCWNNKVLKVILENQNSERFIEIKFNKFKKKNKLSYPSVISIKNKKGNFEITIDILKIHSGLNDKIEFIPGRKFEQIELQ
jgi:hypothetical protein